MLNDADGPGEVALQMWCCLEQHGDPLVGFVFFFFFFFGLLKSILLMYS